MTSPPASIRDWIEYSATGGRKLGLELHEYETSLRVDLNGGTAFLEDHQPSSDKGGEPLGTSRAIVPAELLQQLRDVLDGIDLASIQRTRGSSRGKGSILLKRTRDTASASALFSNRDLDVLQELGPLLQTLDDIVAFVSESPYQAIRLALELAAPAAGPAFSVKLVNVGREAVFLPDLATLARAPLEQPDHWFGVRIAEYPEPTPGYTPPPFHWVRLELLVPPTAPLTLLDPGAQFVFRTAPARKLASGVRHLVQAVFASYAGEAAAQGRVVIRGRALSTALRWVPE